MRGQGVSLRPMPSFPSLSSLLFLELYVEPQSPGQMFILGWAFPSPGCLRRSKARYKHRLVPYFLGLLQVWSQPILGSNLTLRGWSKALRWDRLGLPDCSTWTHWVRIKICDFKLSSISDIFTV